jgi:hypothetical protein
MKKRPPKRQPLLIGLCKVGYAPTVGLLSISCLQHEQSQSFIWSIAGSPSLFFIPVADPLGLLTSSSLPHPAPLSDKHFPNAFVCSLLFPLELTRLCMNFLRVNTRHSF